MDFDFYKKYAGYSNTELLRILMLQHQYQPAAVDAVKELLSQRTIAEEERLEAEESIAPKPRKDAEPDADAGWQPGDDIFGTPETMQAFAAVRLHWRIVAVALGISILLNIQFQIRFISAGIRYMASLNWNGYLTIAIMILQVCSYILYCGKKRWGWILTIGWISFMFLSNLFSLATFIYAGRFFSQSLKVVVQLLLLGGSAVSLLSPGLKSFYRIDRETVVRTIAVSLGGSILICALIILWVYARSRML